MSMRRFSMISRLFLAPEKKLRSTLQYHGEEDEEEADVTICASLKRLGGRISAETRRLCWLRLSPQQSIHCTPEFQQAIQDTRDFRDLQKDVRRSWPLDEHAQFSEGSPEMQSFRSDIETILVSFWNVNADVGYCQGLHLIANMVHHEMNGNLDDSLLVLRGIVESLMVGSSYVHKNLNVLNEPAKWIRDYLVSQDKQLMAVLEHAHILSLLSKWCLSGFVNALPQRVVRRLFDGVLCDGIRVFFAAAIVLLRWRRQEIIAEGSSLGVFCGHTDFLIGPTEETRFIKDVEEMRLVLVFIEFDTAERMMSENAILDLTGRDFLLE